ncbi:27 kDa hemolymph protein-like [Choristoneura fumiferana]|uniref:27 kDa hemolymph protein-like n=1 Tax=Choristoneura fumiferana TaxID=7141 RepID=UPI003D159302
MLWKLAFVAVLAVGVLGEYKVTDEHKQQVKDFITMVCKKTNAEDKAPEVETAVLTFGECVTGLFDASTLQREIEEAKPNGALDEVFKKYCAKSPQLKACIHAVTAGATPCLPAEFRDHVAVADNATDKLLDFACHKDGDRIALFIAEGGPQCFQEKSNAIRDCTNSLKSTFTSVQAATALTTAERCAKFDETAACVVTALEGCSNPTPANMAESLLKFVRTVTPCNAIPKKN